MIPKIIHYCWFGGNPLPESAKKCIASWHKFFPDYEIKEWNEDNFDVNIIPYTKEAYEAKKYAFVSDYARFWILYHHGGLYFDTDVEVIKPMEHIVNDGAFMGIEKLNPSINNVDTESMVNPGLGLGAQAHHPLFKEVLDYYNELHWCDENGNQLPGTVVHHTTKILLKHGFVQSNKKQSFDGVTIYPSDVFCPMDSTTGITKITPNSVSIHHYTCSWMDQNSLSLRIHLLKNWCVKILGGKFVSFVANILKGRF